MDRGADARSEPHARPTGVIVRPGSMYRLAASLDTLPADLRLLNVEWGVLFAITGEHTVAEIGDHFGLGDAERLRVFTRLVQKRLVEERELSYGEYLRAAASVRDSRPRTLAAFLRDGAARPANPRAAAHAAAVEPEPPASALDPAPSEPPRDASSRSRQTAPVEPLTSRAPTPPPTLPANESTPVRWSHDDDLTRPVPTFDREDLERSAAEPSGPERISFHPLAAPGGHPADASAADDAAAERARQLSLERIMRFIIDRAPDMNAGQLDVYRVFIRVDTKLLKRNGITTLRFADDRLIEDPELQDAITASVERTLGIDVPETVYVAA